MEANEAASFKACRQAVAELYVDIEENQKKGAYATQGGFYMYQKDIDELEKKYMDRKRLGAKVKWSSNANVSVKCLHSYFRWYTLSAELNILIFSSSITI